MPRSPNYQRVIDPRKDRDGHGWQGTRFNDPLAKGEALVGNRERAIR